MSATATSGRRPRIALCAAVIAALAAVGSAAIAKDYDPILDQIGDKTAYGAKMRLSTTGLAYIREIGMRVINREIPKLILPTTTANVQPSGTVTLSNMKVVDYWPPTEYNLDMNPPDEFTWSMINMGVRWGLIRLRRISRLIAESSGTSSAT